MLSLHLHVIIIVLYLQCNCNHLLCNNLFSGLTVGFRSSSYLCDETGGPILVCIQIYNGNLERNVSMKIASIDGSAEGKNAHSNPKFNKCK